MNIKVAVKIISSVLCIMSFGTEVFSQQDFISTKDIFGTRTFVQNNGQFDLAIQSTDKIYYSLENGDEKIYFTSTGLIYKLIKRHPLTEKQREAVEHGKQVNRKANDVYHVKMNWINANPNPKIRAESKQSWYMTYGQESYKSGVYKKIIYKNVYNNIDVEYIIPEDKDHGIKYNLILHPGADPGNIKIAYSGDVKSISKQNNEIIIKTPLGDIIEHSPNSFYGNNETVKSEFILEDKVICYNFPNGYDNSKTLTVDPWVTSITGLPPNNKGYDIDYDAAGNLFVFGGYGSSKVAKYDPLGTLLWTFSGIIISPAWDSNGDDFSNNTVGNFVVEKITGKTYMCEPINTQSSPPGVKIIRLDVNGIYDNYISTPVWNWNELWDMGYDCNTGKIYGFGGGIYSNLSAGLFNTITGSVNPISFFPSGPGTCQDIACNTIDDQGNVFVIYATPDIGYRDYLVRLNPAFTNTVWAASSTYYGVMSEGLNTNKYVGFSGEYKGSFNCLAVNNNNLFYHDGMNLAAYDKTTGIKTGSAVLTATVERIRGGITVDDCNTVYIGGSNSVNVFYFTGTSFIQIGSIPLGVAGPDRDVYDIKLNKSTKLLYVSGNGFTGVFSAIQSSSCTPANDNCPVDSPLNIPQTINGLKGISITPNPFSNKIAITSSGQKQPVLIYNALGSLIYKREIETEKTELDLEMESSGIYFIRVGTVTKKIIKE
jgi:hypothetical protein